MPRMNGISEGEYKFKAGKLIRVRAMFEGEIIKKIRITGDFFLHPEDKIEEIEKSLENQRVGEIDGLISSIMRDAEYEGISPEALSHAIREAWKRRV